MAHIIEASEEARRIAMHELAQVGIEADSPAGEDFLLRASAFGIMGVQPPRTELNQTPVIDLSTSADESK